MRWCSGSWRIASAEGTRRAGAVAPQAGEWIHQASQAIRAEIPTEKLRDMVAQFPTYSEAYLNALEQLDI